MKYKRMSAENFTGNLRVMPARYFHFDGRSVLLKRWQSKNGEGRLQVVWRGILNIPLLALFSLLAHYYIRSSDMAEFEEHSARRT